MDMSANSTRSISALTLPEGISGTPVTQPCDSERMYEVVAMLAPSTTGPMVMTAQYTSTLCASGRRLRTRQMALNCVSMFDIRKNAVRMKKKVPAVPSSRAWPAKVVMLLETWLAMASGIRFCTIHCSSASCSRANTGKAVNTESITAKKGTMAVRVVSVRLLAVSAR